MYPADAAHLWETSDAEDPARLALDLTPDPHVLIGHQDFYRFTATYQFGTQHGEIDGRVDEVWPDAEQLFLTFVRTDDGEEVFGAAGDAGYNGGDRGWEEMPGGSSRVRIEY